MVTKVSDGRARIVKNNEISQNMFNFKVARSRNLREFCTDKLTRQWNKISQLQLKIVAELKGNTEKPKRGMDGQD